MTYLKKGFVSFGTFISGAVVGGVTGLIYLILDQLRCVQVHVPPVRPIASVSVNFSNVNLDGVLSFPNGLDEDLLKQRLSQVDINTDISVPNVEPQIDASDCTAPIYIGLGVGAGLTTLGLAAYHLASARMRSRYNDYPEGLELESQEEPFRKRDLQGGV